VVAKNAVIPQYPTTKGLTFWRSTLRDVYLHEVLVAANRAVQGENVPVILGDPLTMMGEPALQVLTIPPAKQWGLTWMAVAVPLELTDVEGGFQPIEPMRWFCAPHNIWAFMSRSVPGNVPFVSPVWNGWVGTWAHQHMTMRPRFHDITPLRSVAIWQRNEEIPLEASEMVLTLNPPDVVYLKA
jgi:hypothetical protein